MDRRVSVSVYKCVCPLFGKMADKTDKVKTILNSHTEKLADIEDKVDNYWT